MKSAGLIVLALAEIGSGAPTGERVSAQQVFAAPKTYVGRKIVVSGIPCVDIPRGSFTCVARVGGQVLRIEASGLGAKTKLEIAERLTGECKGKENLARPACRFDAEIQPTNGYREPDGNPDGSDPATVVFSPSIEMYEPQRRRK